MSPILPVVTRNQPPGAVGMGPRVSPEYAVVAGASEQWGSRARVPKGDPFEPSSHTGARANLVGKQRILFRPGGMEIKAACMFIRLPVVVGPRRPLLARRASGPRARFMGVRQTSSVTLPAIAFRTWLHGVRPASTSKSQRALHFHLCIAGRQAHLAGMSQMLSAMSTTTERQSHCLERDQRLGRAFERLLVRNTDRMVDRLVQRQYANVVADVNYDGKADLVSWNSTSVWVELSNASSFGSPTQWSSGSFSGSLANVSLSGPPGAYLMAVDSGSAWSERATGSAFGSVMNFSSIAFVGSVATSLGSWVNVFPS